MKIEAALLSFTVNLEEIRKQLNVYSLNRKFFYQQATAKTKPTENLLFYLVMLEAAGPTSLANLYLCNGVSGDLM